MLKSLYDYAMRCKLVLPPGYVNKSVKAYISLSSADPDYVGIQSGDDTEIPCPDIGSAANGKSSCNALVEKRSVVIPNEPTPKSGSFLESLRSASEYEPTLTYCVRALETPEIAAKIREQLDREKIKPADRISFKVDNQNILKSERVLSWWAEYRRRFEKAKGENQPPCLISGTPSVPLATVPKVHGLRPVGGHSSGDALVCFDKASFCSYDLKQGENAPVSEEAFSAANQGLEYLLKDAPVLSGMKFVHWFSKELPPEDDPILQSVDFYGWDEDAGEEQDSVQKSEEEHSPSNAEEQYTPSNAEEQRMRKQADGVPESAWSGESFSLNRRIVYHILLLSGAGGRVMIRRYEQGNYQELCKNLDRWREDLRLVTPGGTSCLQDRKLFARLARLIGFRKNDRKTFDRVRDELSGITANIVHAILNGTPLPDSVAARALTYIRSQMLSGKDENVRSVQLPDGIACQWLKVWLIRHPNNYNQEVRLMAEYNMQSKSVPYHCGGLMALFAEIQRLAMPDVNASIVERYYASAIQTPALVIGQLSRLSTHHLEKIENGWLSDHYREKLRTVSAAIATDALPVTLKLQDQSAFAMGYYQMGAQISKERGERVAARKAKDAAKMMNADTNDRNGQAAADVCPAGTDGGQTVISSDFN